MAMVNSSGPDRSQPIERVVLCDPKVGIVSGHRIAIVLSRNNKPIMRKVFETMAAEVAAPYALEQMLGENPEADVGVVAINCQGRIGMRNSSRVECRPDVATACCDDPESGAKAAVSPNEIRPLGIAQLAAGMVMGMMAGTQAADWEVALKAGLRVEHGSRNQLHSDHANQVVRWVTTDRAILAGQTIGVAPYLQSQVIRGGKVVGQTINEPLWTLTDGLSSACLGKMRLQSGAR